MITPSKEKSLLITGGAGFIGSQVSKMAARAGHHVIVFDNLSTGNKENVKYGTFIHGDLADTKAVNEVFSDHHIDAVIHLAALIDVGESVADPLKYYGGNVACTLNLLDAMARHHIHTLIFSSSAAIFGLPLSLPVNEDHPCQPINPYGETKLIIEKLLIDCDAAYGIKSSCLRYFNAAGGDPEAEITCRKAKESNLIPLVLKSLKSSTSAITVYGDDYPTEDGTCIRDYIHVQDLASAHLLALNKLLHDRQSTRYNLGNGKGFSVKEVIAAAEKMTGLKARIIVGERRPGDPPILVADASKATQELGWTPKFPHLEEMIKHAWNARL